ncbi:MAG: glutamate 5-kinase [Patescibacteria group bacterium]|nr:glutamate 5-kinase [Patescibacteria group bacterium]
MYKRIIVKVGTNVLTTHDGKLDVGRLKHLVEQISAAKSNGAEVVLVSSGAMGAGRGLVAPKRADKIAEKQVLAAVGQVELMRTYSEAFAQHSLRCAQVLATKEDFRDKTHYLNMRACFENLLASGVVPVVNENDVVATTELLFTDNDELAGLVAAQLNADAVIVLTSTEGFLAGDPSDKKAKVVPEIAYGEIGTYEKYISPDKTSFGRGGMLTKFAIAKKLAGQGIAMHLASGMRESVIADILGGRAVGTKFLPRGRSSAIKRRIAYSEGLTKGSVQVNKCARELLLSKTKIMSLLPVGAIKVEGDFNKGDIIEILGERGENLGFGIAEYGADRAKELLGVQKARPIIHYNHMFISA